MDTTKIPKTEDGHKVKIGDLVWCRSDPFMPVFITVIHPFEPEVGKKEFTLWLDPRDGEGDFPANNHEVFKCQQQCLFAARRQKHEEVQTFERSIKTMRKEIDSINKVLNDIDWGMSNDS